MARKELRHLKYRLRRGRTWSASLLTGLRSPSSPSVAFGRPAVARVYVNRKSNREQ
jgi:hypothetical protein